MHETVWGRRWGRRGVAPSAGDAAVRGTPSRRWARFLSLRTGRSLGSSFMRRTAESTRTMMRNRRTHGKLMLDCIVHRALGGSDGSHRAGGTRLRPRPVRRAVPEVYVRPAGRLQRPAAGNDCTLGHIRRRQIPTKRPGQRSWGDGRGRGMGKRQWGLIFGSG